MTKDNIPQKQVNRRVSHALLVNMVPTRLLQTVAVKIVQPGGIDQQIILIQQNVYNAAKVKLQ